MCNVAGTPLANEMFGPGCQGKGGDMWRTVRIIGGCKYVGLSRQTVISVDKSQGGASVRAALGIVGLAGGSLMGKLRIRVSSLVPGRLHTVGLPLQVCRTD